MTIQPDSGLSRRERQIMDIIYALESASVTEVMEQMADPPSYSSVRTIMRILVEKGHLKRKPDGARYNYLPSITPKRASRSALSHLLKTFFAGSTEAAVVALIDLSRSILSKTDLDRIINKIDEIRKGEDNDESN